MARSKVVKYRRPLNSKIWKTSIFLIVIYILILFFTYTNKDRVTIYEVNNAQIADDTTWEGIIIRNEKICKTQHAGYINYYNPAGNRVGVGDILYTIDGSGDISDLLSDIDSPVAPSHDEITNIRRIISLFQDNFSFSHYNEVYDYYYDIENAVFEQLQDSIYSDLEKNLKKNGNNSAFHKITAKEAGIISYTLDGMESMKEKDVNPEAMKKRGELEKTQLREKETVEKNAPVYRLIKDENWSIIVPINQSYYEKLKDKTSIRITVKKDNISFNVAIRLELRSDGGYYAVLSTNRFMERYSNDRFLEIEFNLNSASGLKIPNSSIKELEFYTVKESFMTSGGDGKRGFVKQQFKEDGTKDFVLIPLINPILIDGLYYVRKDLLKAGDVIVEPETQQNDTISTIAKLEGVFCVNQGFCKFVRIEKIYENSEYTIISDKTANGLIPYDHIVVEPQLLNENDFIQ